MTTRSKAAQQREASVAAMRKFWDSLDTHLDFAIEQATKKELGTCGGNRRFHANTVREYAQSILDLAKHL